MTTTRRTRRTFAWAGAATGAVLLTAGLLVFEPWALWIDNTVVEAAPVAAAPVTTGPVITEPVTTEPVTRESVVPSEAVATEPVTEYRGEFISHEHATSGSVRILRLPDGSRVLRLEDLDTSNGPDLKVVLSDAPVRPGKSGWHVFDDGAHVKLGSLKGNKGSQNYPVPSDVDVAGYRSVSIWCDRFNVSFGASELERAQS